MPEQGEEVIVTVALKAETTQIFIDKTAVFNDREAKHDENLARRTAAEHAEEECLRQTGDL